MINLSIIQDDAPDWRWQTASAVAGRGLVSPYASDPGVLLAVHYLSAAEHTPIGLRIEQAVRVHENAELSFQVQLLCLCHDLTLSDIAVLTGVPASVVYLYEMLFYDVRRFHGNAITLYMRVPTVVTEPFDEGKAYSAFSRGLAIGGGYELLRAFQTPPDGSKEALSRLCSIIADRLSMQQGLSLYSGRKETDVVRWYRRMLSVLESDLASRRVQHSVLNEPDVALGVLSALAANGGDQYGIRKISRSQDAADHARRRAGDIGPAVLAA